MAVVVGGGVVGVVVVVVGIVVGIVVAVDVDLLFLSLWRLLLMLRR